MDIKTAFTYMFKDKDFLPKYLTGVLLLFPLAIGSVLNVKNYFIREIPFIGNLSYTTLLIFFYTLSAIGLLLTMVTCGYNLINLNARIYKKDSLLPQWNDIKNILFASLKAVIIYTLFILLYCVITAILAVAMIIFLSLFIKSNLQGLSIISSSITALIIIFAIAIITPAQVIAFGTDLRIKSFFNFKLAWNIVKENKLKYFLCLISVIIVFIINYVIGKFALTQLYVIQIFSPFITNYLALVLIEILANVPRPETEAMPMETEQAPESAE